jgi:hypothetical protein
VAVPNRSLGGVLERDLEVPQLVQPAIQASIVLAIVLVVVAYFSPQVAKKFTEFYNEVRGSKGEE